MSIEADLKFGIEPIRVGTHVEDLDVCQVADDLFDVMNAMPTDVGNIRQVALSKDAVNSVVAKYGYPAGAFPTGASAYKFSQDVMAKAIEIKKKADSVWRSEDAPALPDSIPELE